MSKLKEFTARVEKNFSYKDGRGIHGLRFYFPEKINPKPGQFIALEAKVGTANIWRPFSVVGVEGNFIESIIKTVGSNTSEYAKLKQGELIKVKGPLGKPITINPDDKSYILVAGGMGAAGLFYLYDELSSTHKQVTFLHGVENINDLFSYIRFDHTIKDYEYITESVPAHKGKVTDLLQKRLEKAKTKQKVIACGPPAMLKAVHDLCEEFGNECVVLVEGVMLCGVGSCKGCAIWGFDEDGNDEVKHICKDGPAFPSKWINWDKFVPKASPVIFSYQGEVKNPMGTFLRGKSKNIEMDSPIVNASGCLGLSAIVSGAVDISRLGALVTKTVTLEPKLGNPLPRTAEVPTGALNAIGLENSGLEVFVIDELSVWLGFGKPVIVNISGNSIEEFVIIAKTLEKQGVTIIEVNISCPNVPGGLAIGTNPILTKELITAIKEVFSGYIITKLSPNVTDITEIAKAAVRGGADAISAINTLQGMSIDIHTGKPKVSIGVCGYSGPGIHPVALAKIFQLKKANLGVPIIGIGGVDDADKAMQFIIGGATAVGVGTSSFGNRNVFTEIYDGLDEIRKKRNANRSFDLVGTVVI